MTRSACRSHLLQRWDVEETGFGRQVPGSLAPADQARYDAVPVLHEHFPDAVAHVSRAQNRNGVKRHFSASLAAGWSWSEGARIIGWAYPSGNQAEGNAALAATPGRRSLPAKNRFKVFHCALFRMWGLGRLGRYRNAFGPQMDGRNGGLSGFGTWLRARTGRQAAVVCARVCIGEIIALLFAAIKGGYRPQIPKLTEGLNTCARPEGLVGDTAFGRLRAGLAPMQSLRALGSPS